MPHLAVPFPAGHPSGSGRFRCRLSSSRCRSVRVPMPRSRVSTVPAACGLRGSAGRVRCPSGEPSVSAGCADLARNPGCPRNRTPRQCPPEVRECGWVLAGRLLSAAAVAPLSRAGTWRSPAADHPCSPGRRRQYTPAACSVHGGSGTSTRAAVQTRVSAGRRAAAACRTLRAVSVVRPEPRPPGDGVRTAGVHRGHRRLRGGCCYRKRSPDRWPLVGCRHRR
jgi:hypothetical protein